MSAMATSTDPPPTETLTMVGHASVVLEVGDLVLWTDPWLTSRAFNDSWEINPPPVLAPDLPERVTHVWISHEHPDHFNVPSLRRLATMFPSRVEFLVQEHPVRGPADFLRSLGFSVTELRPRERLAVGATTLSSYPVGHEDCALMIETPQHTILELNDCKPTRRELRRILRDHPPVDVLLDQFSGAGWNGNPNDHPRKQQQAAIVRSTLRTHVDLIDPVWLVPFASFVRFAHEENAHLAQDRVGISDVLADHAARQLAVLAPGDVWDLARPWNGNDAAVRVYLDAESADAPLQTSESVDADIVIDAAHDFVRRMKAGYHGILRGRVQPVRFVVTDAEPVCDVTVSLTRGVTIDDPRPTATTVRVGSQAAHDAFSKRWGMSTLLISGRFSIDGPEAPFFRLKQLAAAAAVGLTTRGTIRQLRDRRFRALARRALIRLVP